MIPLTCVQRMYREHPCGRPWRRTRCNFSLSPRSDHPETRQRISARHLCRQSHRMLCHRTRRWTCRQAQQYRSAPHPLFADRHMRRLYNIFHVLTRIPDPHRGGEDRHRYSLHHAECSARALCSPCGEKFRQRMTNVKKINFICVGEAGVLYCYSDCVDRIPYISIH